MTCDAARRVAAEARRERATAAYNVQRETKAAELNALRFNAPIYDWGAVRLSEAIRRCWDSRCAQADDALARCKEKARHDKAPLQLD